MTRTRLVRCRCCGTAYTVRTRDDDSYIVPTESGTCRCGSESFAEVGSG